MQIFCPIWYDEKGVFIIVPVKCREVSDPLVFHHVSQSLGSFLRHLFGLRSNRPACQLYSVF